jgi:anthranilate phosphoribosyltransferase
MSELEAVGGWAAVFGALTAGDDLSGAQASAALTEILNGDASPAQIAAFMVALRMKGESVEEMSAMLATLLSFAEPLPLPAGIDVVDTCGTGGDRSHSINVSTIAALVVAGAGAPVCKHGNRAASSRCGSADVLEALGVAVDLDPASVRRCIEEAGMGFCFAPRFHAALRHAGPTRRELGVPTVFNFLGPMANPARARRQVLGVSAPAMAEKMIGVLQANGAERALVVYGHDGLDELTTTTTSTVLELRDGAVRTWDVDPDAFGIARVDAAALRGDDAATNAAAVRGVLAGEKGAHRDFAVLNAAAGLVASGRVDELGDGLVAASEAVDDGRAAAVLARLVEVSQREAAAASAATA